MTSPTVFRVALRTVLRRRSFSLVTTMGIALASVTAAPVHGQCQATPDDGVTVFPTVQQAVDAAGPSATVKVSGTCADGGEPMVAISGDLVLRGGYAPGNWTVSDPVTNPTTLNGQSLGRVVYISGATTTVAIENLTILGGTVSGNNLCPLSCGGGVLSEGPLTMSGVEFLGNNADRDGGGVAAMVDLTIIDSTFSLNTAGFDGGAVKAEGPLNISGSVFSDNTSAQTGGAVESFGPPQLISISGSRFEGNTSTLGGGAVVISAGDGPLGSATIETSEFENNSVINVSQVSAGNGGAIYAFNVDLTVTDTLFTNNRCVDDEGECNGGALYALDSFDPFPTVTLTNTDFVGNSSDANGGGVYWRGGTGVLIVDGGLFQNNTTNGGTTSFSDGGGAVNSTSVTINGATFDGNFSGEDGGAVLIRGSAVSSTITSSSFLSNGAGANGGGVAQAFGGSPTVTGCAFNGNTANLNGGGFWAAGSLELEGGSFFSNTSMAPPNDGGAHLPQNGGGGVWAGGTLDVNGTTFTSNSAVTNGGGVHSEGSVVLVDAVFDSNIANGGFSPFSYGGGGLYAVGNVDLDATTSFQSNLATAEHGKGGGIYATGNVSAIGGVLAGNQAGLAGGGVFVGGDLIVAGTTFQQNGPHNTTFANFQGGGAYVTGLADLDDAVFESNQAAAMTFASGGGITVASGGSLDAIGCTFANNTTSGRGGAAYVFGPVTASGTTVSGNSAEGEGGGISATFDPLDFTDCQIRLNSALSGGGVYSNGAQTYSNSLIEENQATGGQGGGMYTSGQITFTDTLVLSNTAALEGGGGFANSGVVATGGLFSANSSLDASGGGVAAPQGELDIDGADFRDNIAVADGGAAYTRFDATVRRSRFEDNQAARGGGLYVGRIADIDAVVFLGNSAGAGGGLAVTEEFSGSTPGMVVNTLFSRNQATVSGSGLFLDNPSRPLEVVHCTFANPSLTPGDAIHATSGTMNVTNTIVSYFETGIIRAGTAIVTETYSLFSGNTTDTSGGVGGGTGSFIGVPDFLDPPNDDYRISFDSEAVDAGTDAGVVTDFEGDSRPQGPAPDIGFDERADLTPCYWFGGIGNWHNVNHWDCGVVPGLDEVAIIQGGRAELTVDWEVFSVTQDGGTLRNGATLEIGFYLWRGGRLDGSGLTRVSEGALAGGATKELHQDLEMVNLVTWDEGWVSVADGVVVRTLPGSEFRMLVNRNWGSFGTTATFENQGIVVRESGSGDVQFYTPFNNNGTVDVRTGNFIFRGGGTSNGTFIGTAGTEINFSNGQHHLTEMSSVIADSVWFDNASSTTVNGSFSANSTTVDVSGAVVFNGGPRTLPNVRIIQGTLSGSSDLTISQSLDWTGGVIERAGLTTLGSAASAVLDGNTKVLRSSMANEGHFEWLNGTVGGNATMHFTNRPGATFATSSPHFWGSTSTLTVFDNQGTLIRDGGVGSTSFHAQFNNSGTVDVQNGGLIFRRGGTSTGTFIGTAETEINFSDGEHHLTEASSVMADSVWFDNASSSVIHGSFQANATTVDVNGTVTFNVADATLGSVWIRLGTLALNDSVVRVTGNFERNYNDTGFSAGTSLVIFDGVGVQNLGLDRQTTFNDVMVSAGAIVVETEEADRATISGKLMNHGIIRKTQPVFGGAVSFGLTGVEMDVVMPGDLTTLQVDRMDRSHPEANGEVWTGRYWNIAGPGTGYEISLTLPHEVTPDDNALVCRYVGDFDWNCDRTDSTPTSVTLEGVTDLSDWAAGDAALEHVVSLDAFESGDTSGWSAQVPPP